jgi:hypothetical protein
MKKKSIEPQSKLMIGRRRPAASPPLYMQRCMHPPTLQLNNAGDEMRRRKAQGGDDEDDLVLCTPRNCVRTLFTCFAELTSSALV